MLNVSVLRLSEGTTEEFLDLLVEPVCMVAMTELVEEGAAMRTTGLATGWTGT